jgi:homoserine dehydrogenase
MKVLRVGMLGFGTVGSAVASLLQDNRRLIAARTGIRFELQRALVRHRRKALCPTTTRPEQVVAEADVDIVLELMGGKEPARTWVSAALANGKPVVTANKALLAAHGPELFAAATRAKRDLFFEAAVAGGVPIIRTLRQGLASDRVDSVTGILNGTTNFILDQMGQGQSYADALGHAQALGYAEADPTLDVSGQDAAEKLSLLCLLAFHGWPESIPTRGIVDLSADVLGDAARRGQRVKLIAHAARAGRKVQGFVQPCFVAGALAEVSGGDNAVQVVSSALGKTFYRGPGAGGFPTATAVVSDLIEVGRNLQSGVTLNRANRAPSLAVVPPLPMRHYVRLQVREAPGVLAEVTGAFAAAGISLADVEQHGAARQVPIVLTTHPCKVAAMQTACAALMRLRACLRAPVVLPILD